MRVTWHGGQIQGERRRQEDAFHAAHIGDAWLGIVADGLGGHPAGDVASREAVHHFAAMVRLGLPHLAPGPALREALTRTDRHLRVLQQEHPEFTGMATTLVALHLRESGAAVSVGDSALLLCRGGELVQLNRMHGAGNVVTSCLGYRLSEVDVAPQLEVRTGDRYLLASDGLLTLAHREVFQILSQADTPRSAVTDLLAAVEARRDPVQDNATLIAAFVD